MMHDKNSKCSTNDVERLKIGRKTYSAAKIEAIFFERDVITTSGGGENGYGVKWDWNTNNIWGE